MNLVRAWTAAGLVALATAATTASLEAQARQRPPASYAQLGIPDQAEGARILEKFREIGLGGAYFFEIELRVMPRRGAERRIPGRWFGDRNQRGPIARVELVPAAGESELWLVQSGPEPAVWEDRDQRFVSIPTAEAMQPLLGTNISAVDLQTPFVYWKDFVYEKLEPFRGRPAHVFLLYPPEHEAERYPGIGGVRVFIDTQFNAFNQAQWLAPDGTPLKTITILNFTKVSERWIPKAFDVLNEQTRDKTRLTIQAAALDVNLSPAILDPNRAAEPADVKVPREKLVRVR